MQNYYKGTKDKPYHLSIGAVLVNDGNKICCHYFKKLFAKTYGDVEDFYILMRETIKVGETIEEALHRGLMEEFGATGEIVTFLGSLRENFSDKGGTIEKTTLYFLVKEGSTNIELRSFDDVESQSEVQWQTPEFLIEKMKEQRSRLKIDTLDESEIVERAKQFLN